MTDKNKEQLKEMNFYLDGIDGIFPGLSKGEVWNGFEYPYFTKEVAMDLVKAFDKLNETVSEQDKIRYNEFTDIFVVESQSYPEEEWETYESVLINGKKYYAIGAMSWAWQNAEDLDEENDKKQNLKL